MREITPIKLDSFPSIMATQPIKTASSKYRYVPTMDLVSDLNKEGWVPVRASQVNARASARQGYQKHMITFRNPSYDSLSKDDLFPEIIMTNSHDTSAAFSLYCGLFRLVCANGLVVADSLFGSFRITHLRYSYEVVKMGIGSVVSTFSSITKRVNEFQTIEMTKDDQMAFAMTAIRLRYNDVDKEVDYEALITPRRKADAKPTLWNTFNMMQENLIKGGIRFNFNTTGRRSTSRGINDINSTIGVNKDLWFLTETIADLKY